MTCRILNLLQAGRIDDAYTKAAQILHSHGLRPLRYSRVTGPVMETTLSATTQRYLMASLLFPLSDRDRKKMLKTVITLPEDA